MTACASNLHQISLALHQYAADNDDYYPINSQTHLVPYLNPVWTLLTPYTRNIEVFHCSEAWGPYATTRGYDYRGAASAVSTGLGNIPPPRLSRPGSGTVVALCSTHTKHLGPDSWATDAQGNFIGPLLVVREDGSTSQIQANLVEHWLYRNGQWMLFPHGLPQPGDWVENHYPGEEWPPQD